MRSYALVTLLLAAACGGCGDVAGPGPDTATPQACSSCHKTPPSSGKHTFHAKILECSACHACVVDGVRTIVDSARHDDGSKDVCAGSMTYDSASRSCGNVGCHEERRW